MHRSHGYETFLKKFLALPARVKDFVREGSEAELSKLHCSIQNPTQRRYHMTSLPANRTQHSGKSDLPFPLYEDFASRWNQLYEADFQTSFFFLQRHAAMAFSELQALPLFTFKAFNYGSRKLPNMLFTT